MAVVNTSISDTFVLRDNTNTALTGKTAADFTTIEAYSLPSGAATATVTLTEIGSGEYTISFTPTTAATWVAHLVYNSGGVFREFSQTYDVTSTSSSTTATTSPTAALSRTRKELRRSIADRFGDLVILTATAAGSTTTLKDSVNINTGVENLNGRELLFTAGTAGNLGLVRRVTSTSDSTNTITFTPAALSATAANDEAEVVNERGKGFTFAEYHRAINRAITDAFPAAVIALRSDITGAFDADTPEVTVPDTMSEVSGVEWQDSDGNWHGLIKATSSNRYGWQVDAAAGQLRLLGTPALAADTATIRLLGYGRQAELTSDTDTCALNPEWVVTQACYHLALGARDKDDQYGSLALVFQKEAFLLRSRLRTYRRSGSERVRPA